MISNNRVLVLDDDTQLLEIYCDILRPKKKKRSSLMAFAEIDEETEEQDKQQFFEVTTANQGNKGVEAVRQSLKEEQPFAMAFVDIRMPPGIDGLEAARMIRELDDNIYIVIVTAYSDKSIDEIQETLIHDVVLARKPLTKEEIFQLARNACITGDKDEELRSMHYSMERKMEEESMVRNYFESLVSSLTEGLLVCNATGMITSINPACAKITEYQEEDLLGMPIETLFQGGVMDKIIMEIIQKGPQRQIQKDLCTYSSEKIPVFISGSVIHSKKDSFSNQEDQSVVLVIHALGKIPV